MQKKHLPMMMGLAVICILGAAPPLDAGSAGEEFFRGKVIRVIVGFSPGGGFDTFARTVARYLGKYNYSPL